MFSNAMIISDSSNVPGEKEVLFVKNGARVPELCLDTSFGRRWPKVVFRSQAPRSIDLLRFHNFTEFIL